MLLPLLGIMLIIVYVILDIVEYNKDRTKCEFCRYWDKKVNNCIINEKYTKELNRNKICKKFKYL